MPIAVGLNNIAHRSIDAKQRRSAKSWQSWKDKADWKREDWNPWRSRQDWGHRGSERASWSRSCGSDAEWQGAGWRQHSSWNNEEGAELRSPRQDAPQPESQTADAPQPQSQTAVAPQPQSNPWATLSDTFTHSIWQPPPPQDLPQASGHSQQMGLGDQVAWREDFLAGFNFSQAGWGLASPTSPL